MKNLTSFLMLSILFFSGCSQNIPGDLILVKGGNFNNIKSGNYRKDITLGDFYIGKTEVTQKEWVQVMGSNPSQFRGDDLPVEMVSWYECIEYCNARSIKEGLKPFYIINKNKKDPDNLNDNDDLKWLITINKGANGYRLPTEAEWEYAAGGGNISKGFIYSGGNNADEVAWYWRNSGDKYLTGLWSWPDLEKNNNKTKASAGKKSNELGLFDMSGNVREWCWDWQKNSGADDPPGRVWKGGGWMGADFCCEISFRHSHQPNGKGPDQGFRVCRSR